MTIDQWLDAVGQSKEAKSSFWEPLAVSVMNEHIDAASAGVFLRAIGDAFLHGRRSAALALPTVGLSEMFADAAGRFIQDHGGRLRTGEEVVESREEGELIASVRTRRGETASCSCLVLAVPPGRVAALLPGRLRESGFLSFAAGMPVSPIVSIHLWFETDFMNHEVLGVVGRRIQWVFNRRRFVRGPAKGGHVSAVISAARGFVEQTAAELTAVAHEDLRSIYPACTAPPVHSVVIREKRATFSCTPGVEKLRPRARTPMRNLFLAGDWTDTGYPATIEGSILSGNLCADLAASHFREDL
jgi:squalene-associated FAD-dependent desaturase